MDALRLATDCRVNEKEQRGSAGQRGGSDDVSAYNLRCLCADVNILIDSGCKHLSHILPSSFYGDIGETFPFPASSH